MPRRLIPRSLQSRVLLAYLTLLMLGLGGLILWVGKQLQVLIVEQAEHNLELETYIIGNALQEPLNKSNEGETPEGRSLQDLVLSYAANTGARITVTDAQLRVLISSDERVPRHTEENHIEYITARANTEQHDIRWDEWRNEERLFVAAPVRDEQSKIAGFVQMSVPMVPIYAQIRQTWIGLVAAGGLILMAAAVVSVWFASQITRPILKLTHVSEAMAAGKLDQQIAPSGPDEIQRLGRAFNRMAERVREMLARQQDFVAHAAHELRSPLTSLRLRLEMLQTHGQGNGELTRRYLAEMEHEIEHLRRMVDHLLALSSLAEGQDPPRTTLDLAPLLYELSDQLAPLIEQANLKLQVNVPAHLPRVLANAEQMRIAVRNLLDNAIKYTPAGGQITLSANGENGAVQVAVADTGIGIPPDALPRIFERFYRVDKSRARRQVEHPVRAERPVRGGAGLGLALVQSLVEAYGGRVEVKSVPERGSVFTLYLPIAKGE